MGQKAPLTEADKRVLKRLYHPNTLESLRVHCPEATPERVAKLKRDKVIFVVGLEETGGRPREVLCSRKCKIDNLEHELALSGILVSWGYESRRGKEVDQRLLPDATILGGLHVELDRGTEDYSRVEARARGYLECDDPVIFITTSETRKQEILKRCDFLGDGLRACTVAEALADEVTLQDCEGKEYILRKAGWKRRGSSGKPATETPDAEEVRETP